MCIRATLLSKMLFLMMLCSFGLIAANNQPDYGYLCQFMMGLKASGVGQGSVVSVRETPVGLSDLVSQTSFEGQFACPSPSVDFSRPLPGLNAAQLARFEAGKEVFADTEGVEDGLGPIFNNTGCGQCHNLAGVGGGSDSLFEIRFGIVSSDSTSFDPLIGLGGSLLQLFTIGSDGTPAGCFFPQERVPAEANMTTKRRVQPLFGLGLPDAVPDQTYQTIAALESVFFPSTAGRVSTAVNLAQSTPRVAKFGWKAQVPNLFQFAGNAYVNEMGITNPEFPLENCPNDTPNCLLMQECNPVPGLNDNGEDVQKFTDFMRFLAPPPRGPITCAVREGGEVFLRIGCANCHLPTLVTGPDSVAALSKKVFHPYSDFLLHDMGTLGDGTSGDQGNASFVLAIATPKEMRTQPLWGTRVQKSFLHDGRASSPTEAILAHDGQGAQARNRFVALRSRDRSNLLAFLNSL